MLTVAIGPYNIFNDSLDSVLLNGDKKVINTINAHSYIIAKEDEKFKEALVNSDILLPDGEGIVLMVNKLNGENIKKIAGADIHSKLLELAEKNELKCFYLGSSEKTLMLINEKLSKIYNHIKFNFYSPPFKESFSEQDNREMIESVNSFNPDILFVGMTAPKQEKWVHQNKEFLSAKVICSIGAVFDFISGTKKRAPQWVINFKLEWLYRSFTAWRLTKRYMYSTPLFLLELFKLKYLKKS